MNDSTTIIKSPVIRNTGFHFGMYEALWKRFAQSYNEDKDYLRDKLRSRDYEVYRLLIVSAKKECRDNASTFRDMPEKCAIDASKWFPVQASVQLFSSMMGLTPRAVEKYLDRLEKVGVISRNSDLFNQEVGRSRIVTFRRKEVLINPDFLLFFDCSNADFTPTSPHLEATVNRTIQKDTKKSFRTVQVSGKKNSNNRIMDVDNSNLKGVSSRNNSPILPDQNLTPDTTTKQVTPVDDSKQNKEEFAQKTSEKPVKTQETKTPEQGSARKIEEEAQNTDTLAVLKLEFARTFYIYLVQHLFSNHKVYAGEAQKAIAYAAKTYFSTVSSREHAEFLLKSYKKRVDLVASYIQRKNFDFSNIYPCAYLNVNNKKGFATTKEWLEVSHSYRQAKEERKRQYAAQMKEKEVMEQLMEQYSDTPSFAEVNRSMALLGKYLPHLQNEYMQFVDSIA